MDDLLHIPDPSLPTLRDLFGRSTWSRGTDYVQQERVRQVVALEDENAAAGWVVDAKVRGNAVRPYDTGVDLACDDQGQWWFQNRCSCPMESRCKHVAALVQYLAAARPDIVPRSAPRSLGAVTSASPAVPTPVPRPVFVPPPPPPSPPPAPSALDRWWSASDESTRSPVSFQFIPDNEVVVFTLSLRTTTPFSKDALPKTELMLGCHRVTLLKGKPGQTERKFGKLRALGSGSWKASQQSHDRVFQDVARWLWLHGSLSGASSQGYSGYGFEELPPASVDDAFGLATLERAVRSGRVVSVDAENRPGRVWSWGEPRTLCWHWARLPDGAWQLLAQIDEAYTSARLLPVPGAVSLYLDDAHGQVGALDLDGLTPERVTRLLAAPPMPDDWLRQQAAQPRARRLLPLLPDAVATPVVRRIRGVAPQPVLHIDFEAGSAEPLFTLSFDYAGERDFWPDSAPAQQFIDAPDGLVELVRDPAQEAATVRACREDGLHPQPGAPADHWCPIGLDLRERQRRFGAWLAEDFATWRAAGFVIETGQGWGAHVNAIDQLDIALGGRGADGAFDALGPEGAAPENAGDWLHLSIGFRIEGRRVNLLPWIPQLVAQAHARPGEDLVAPERLWVHDDQGHWWGLPGVALQPWLAALIELVGERPAGAFQGETLELSRIEVLRLGAETVQVDLPEGQTGLGMLRDILAARGEREHPEVIDGVAAELRPYQHQGVAWLQALSRQRLGGVLADDMGLGKTLQTLAHLVAEKGRGALDRPALIVAPTSLVGNWRRECGRFAPGLRLLVLHGIERRGRFDDIADHDVVLTTYPLLPRDAEILIQQPWHAVVLDEAQTIKNAKTQAAQVVQMLQARHRICLSGTPMENHLGEVWSLFEFLLPGYLSSEARFKTLFRTPIEKHGDSDRLALLRRRLAPFMLRRTKDMVATELPPKVETVVRVQFDVAQANLYETIRLSTEASVREALAEKGLARSHIMVLDALLKLRQVCCDPRLVKIPQARKVKGSAKLDWLMETLPEMVAEGRRILLFSQFTSMLELIETGLKAAGLCWITLTGQTPGPQRDALIAQFTDGQVPIFLISLKAGGVGLNLPQADTVIHYDPWWNPAVENQATDRAHRLGQTQTVFVYKLVAEDTLEERILALQERKAALAAGLHGAAGTGGVALTESDLAWLLRPLGAAVEAAETSLNSLNRLENS
ncbi:DEAD/DEAH box helicase [Sphaerotilus sp.]|uniref:DEAD/DEAH box helicase n=1 Tax=Sphaerotilus sp. TaxID=2093942 RepID=UPI002ACE082D|nr:DEAD/DEAH box helicase [Sphaerotilus sp.]MDZ7858894.1 DEAD/DEAH box helicase [Sphaerotilus sp.]